MAQQLISASSLSPLLYLLHSCGSPCFTKICRDNLPLPPFFFLLFFYNFITSFLGFFSFIVALKSRSPALPTWIIGGVASSQFSLSSCEIFETPSHATTVQEFLHECLRFCVEHRFLSALRIKTCRLRYSLANNNNIDDDDDGNEKGRSSDYLITLWKRKFLSVHALC